MARKSRYLGYYRMAMRKEEKKKSTPGSVRCKLKELQEKNTVLSVPVENTNEA